MLHTSFWEDGYQKVRLPRTRVNKGGWRKGRLGQPCPVRPRGDYATNALPRRTPLARGLGLVERCRGSGPQGRACSTVAERANYQDDRRSLPYPIERDVGSVFGAYYVHGPSSACRDAAVRYSIRKQPRDTTGGFRRISQRQLLRTPSPSTFAMNSGERPSCTFCHSALLRRPTAEAAQDAGLRLSCRR